MKLGSMAHSITQMRPIFADFLFPDESMPRSLHKIGGHLSHPCHLCAP